MRNPFAPLIAIPRRGIPCTIAGGSIGLKFRRLHGGAKIIELSDDPGDASCEKHPHHASPNLVPPPQPIEKNELTIS